MIFFVAPEVSLSSYYLNRQAIHCKSSTVLNSGGNYFLRHQDFHWQLVSEQPIWESLSFFRSQESRGQAVLSLVSAICLLPRRGAWNAPGEGGRCAQTEAGWREECVPHREPWGRSAFFRPPLPVIPVTSAGPAVCSRMQKWMRRILAYSYKVREWRAGVYTRVQPWVCAVLTESLHCPASLTVVPVLISGSQGLCVWCCRWVIKGLGRFCRVTR